LALQFITVTGIFINCVCEQISSSGLCMTVGYGHWSRTAMRLAAWTTYPL